MSRFNFIYQKDNIIDNIIFKFKTKYFKMRFVKAQLHIFLSFIFTFISSNTFFVFYFHIQNSKYEKS